MNNESINAIERVLDKRALRGASDGSLIKWLEYLKTVWKSDYSRRILDGFVDAIKQTPLMRGGQVERRRVHSPVKQRFDSAPAINF